MNYNINNDNLPKILNSIKQELQSNAFEIEELLKIDYKHSKLRINTEELKNLVDNFKTERLYLQNEQKLLIDYNGNPYVTLNLCILAILTKTMIFLEFSENMLAINKFIIETINKILNEFNTEKLVIVSDNKSMINYDKIICIDDINKYNSYVRMQKQNVKFYSHNYIDFYSDTDEFYELTELIFQNSEINGVQIESYSELEINEAVQMLNNGLGNQIVLLTHNNETKHNFQTNIKNKRLIINKNPFTKEFKIINKEIFE